MSDKFKAAIEEMRLNNGDLIDGLFETIERLTDGNPRLLKKERKVFAKFFLVVIEQMSLNLGVASRINDIREVVTETSGYKSTVVDLYEERNKLTIQIYKVLRRLLRDGETIEAVNMLEDLIKHLDR